MVLLANPDARRQRIRMATASTASANQQAQYAAVATPTDAALPIQSAVFSQPSGYCTTTVPRSIVIPHTKPISPDSCGVNSITTG